MTPEEFGPRYLQAATMDALRTLVSEGGYARMYQDAVLHHSRESGFVQKAELYFDAVGEWLLSATGKSMRSMAPGEPIRNEELARAIRDSVGNFVVDAPNRADAALIATCAVFNLAAAEGCSVETEQMLWAGWLRAAEDPAIAGTLLLMLETEGATLAATTMRELLELVASPRWQELPPRGASVACAATNYCRACGRTHHAPYWNFIAYSDRELREGVAAGTLHRFACLFCRSEDVVMAGAVPFVPESKTFLTSRIICCTTHYGAIVLGPPEFAQFRADAELVVTVVSRRWLALDDRDVPRSDFTILDPAQLAAVLQESLAADGVPGAEYARFYDEYLRMFVWGIRQGSLRLEDVEAYLARELARRPELRPPGLVLRRFDSRDPDAVLTLALMARLHAAGGDIGAAILALTEAAQQAGTASRPGEAMWLLDRAQRLIDEHPDVDPVRRAAFEMQLSVGRGHVECLLGNHEKGIAELERGVELARQSPNPEDRPNLAAALSYLGAELSVADLARGYAALTEAIAICDELLAGELEPKLEQFLQHTRSGALANLGKLYQHAQLFTAIGRSWSAPFDAEHVVRVAQLTKERGWSAATVLQNVAFLQTLHPELVEIDGLACRISPELIHVLDEKKMELYRAAYAIASAREFSAYAAIQATNLSEALALHGKHDEAELWARRAEQHAEDSGDTEALVIAFTEMADTLRQNGRLAEARERLRRAYTAWMQLRRNVTVDRLRIAASETIAPLADRFVRALEGADAAEWIATLETMKAGALSDAMLRPPLRIEAAGTLADLERSLALLSTQVPATADEAADLRARRDRLRAEYDAERERLLLRNPEYSRWFANAPVGFPDGEALLARLHERYGDSAVVGLWVANDEVLAYGTRRGAAAWTHRIPLLDRLQEETGEAWRTLGAFTTAYREALFALARSRDQTPFRRMFAEPLYRALWAKLEPFLGDASHVVLSSHADLHAMPWGTLWDGNAYLASRVDFSQVFSFTVRASPSQPAARARVLVVVNPTLDLQGTEAEAQAIAGHVPPGIVCDVVAREDATVERFLASAPGANVVHLACHARFDPGSPWDSALLMHGSEPLTMAIIADRADLRAAELVVLSACETGLAEVRAGDEALGLTRSFHFAGARNVIASLWRIGDRETAKVMEHLYARLLAGGTSPAAALGGAQREMLARTPFGWGAFVHYTL